MTTHLSQAIAARYNAAAEGAAIDAQIAKLSTLAQSTCGATAQLNTLRDLSAVAFEAWSQTGEGAVPTVDAKRQAKLRDEIEAHRVSTDSASRAIQGLNAKRNAATQTEQRASRAAHVMAIEQTLADALPTFMAAINEAGQALAEKIGAIDGLFGFVTSEAHRLGERSLFVAMERAREMQSQLTVKPEVIADQSRWFAHLSAILQPVANEELI